MPTVFRSLVGAFAGHAETCASADQLGRGGSKRRCCLRCRHRPYCTCRAALRGHVHLRHHSRPSVQACQGLRAEVEGRCSCAVVTRAVLNMRRPDSTGTLCVTTAEPDTELREPRRSASLQAQGWLGSRHFFLTFYVTFQVVWPHDPYWSRPHLSGIIIM